MNETRRDPEKQGREVFSSRPCFSCRLSRPVICIRKGGSQEGGKAAAGTLSLFLDMINTGTRIGFLHLELTAQADILGALDREILRRP